MIRAYSDGCLDATEAPSAHLQSLQYCRPAKTESLNLARSRRVNRDRQPKVRRGIRALMTPRMAWMPSSRSESMNAVPRICFAPLCLTEFMRGLAFRGCSRHDSLAAI